MAEEESTSQPNQFEPVNPFDQSGFDGIMLEIRMKAGALLLNIRDKRTPNWIEKEPTEWVMLLLTLVRACSRAIMNYRELRKGFIEIAAVCLCCANFGDQLAADHARSKS